MNSQNVQEESAPDSQLGGRFVRPDRKPASSTTGVRDGLVAFKFGGSSLLGARCMLHAANLVRPVAERSRVVVIVSAMKGVTDGLLTCAQALAERKHQRARAEAEAVLRLHDDVL